MTKYEELDIAGLTAMELTALIQPGDMLTISGPGTCDTAVRIVNENRRVYSFMATAVIDVDRLARMAFVKIAKIERPIPEVELPTEPGYYLSTKYPLNVCPYMYRLRESGHWYGVHGKVTEARMRDVMPLTRLVPEAAPAKLVDRLDVDKLASQIICLEQSGWSHPVSIRNLIAAIDNGELDK